MMRQQEGLRARPVGSLRLLLSLALVAHVASVPTSVLVQESELTPISNGNRPNNNNKLNNDLLMTKVKRSSAAPNGKETAVASLAGSGGGSTSNMNKKSSPEILPASFNEPQPPAAAPLQAQPTSVSTAIAVPNNSDLISSAIAAGLTAAAVEAAAAAATKDELLQQQQQQQQRQQQQIYADEEEEPSILNKRGINSQQYLYGGDGGFRNSDYYNNPYLENAAASLAPLPNGLWADEIEPAGVVYNGLQDVEEYPSVARVPNYRSKAYDNLQNILNSEAYLDPVMVPLAYSARYYNAPIDADRSKRTYSNNNVFNRYNKYSDLRLKRETKLTPADMLALVALVEAGERARKDTDADAGYIYPAETYVPKTYSTATNNFNNAGYDYAAPTLDNNNNNNNYNEEAWWEREPPAADYYGVPVNMEPLAKYEILPREQKYGAYSSNAGNRFRGVSAKRYMVAKKKRAVATPRLPYNSENYF